MRNDYIPDNLLRRFIEIDLSEFYYKKSYFKSAGFTDSWLWTAENSSVNSLRQKLQFYFGRHFPELYPSDLRFEIHAYDP